MKKFNIGLGVAAVALAIAVSTSGVYAAQGDTDLAGTACNFGTDITVSAYNIDYGTASAADFVAGFTNAGTEDGTTEVNFTDNCGTYTSGYTLTVSFGNMTGADNGDVIVPARHDITVEIAPGYNDDTGTIANEVTGNPAANFNGSVTTTILTRGTASGAVGSLDIDLTHQLIVPAADVVYDSSYDGFWYVDLNLN